MYLWIGLGTKIEQITDVGNAYASRCYPHNMSQVSVGTRKRSSGIDNSSYNEVNRMWAIMCWPYRADFSRSYYLRLPRPCYGIASFLITTKEFTSLVLITDDDVAVTWLVRIMLKLLSRSSIICRRWLRRNLIL